MEHYHEDPLDLNPTESWMVSDTLRVDEEDVLLSENRRKSFQTGKTRMQFHLNSKWFRCVKEVIWTCFAVWGAGSMIYHLWWSTYMPSTKTTFSYDPGYAVQYAEEPCYCGASTAEALTRGCKYDELSAGWLPENCRDDELTNEFGRIGDGLNGTWSYWADQNHTQLLSLEQVALYADKQPANFHMSWEWHKQHCLFLWRKEHRFKINGKIFDPRSDSEHHILHCNEILTQKSSGTSAGASLVG